MWWKDDCSKKFMDNFFNNVMVPWWRDAYMMMSVYQSQKRPHASHLCQVQGAHPLCGLVVDTTLHTTQTDPNLTALLM